jgi:shikimate dehydrogenase
MSTAPADLYAVAGNPVAHSRSPAIHAAFAAQTGQHLVYDRLLCPLEGFAPTLQAFARQPGARGCNVTVPFKFEAFHLAARRTPRATLAQAANTLRFDAQSDGGWLADNTDGAGLVRDITVNAGCALEGSSVLLIGAGGAAAGVLGPLIDAGAARIVVANRTLQRAAELVERHAGLARERGMALQTAMLADCGQQPALRGFDVVINGTAASLDGAGVPVGDGVLRPGTLALDMMYGEPARAFLAWAARHGATGRDGLGMLVEQAAESFALWRGVRPDTAPVLAALRAEVHRSAA